MKDKYNLTLEQNIFLAKRNIVDNVYSNARVEGINITSLKIDEIQCVLNLRDAWHYVINNIEEKFDLEFICKINGFVARNESLDWGKLRNRKSGNNWNRIYSRNSTTKKCYRKD